MWVRDAMTPDPATVEADVPLLVAMERLRDGGFRRLPVVEGGRLVGLVTARDLSAATPGGQAPVSVYDLDDLLARTTVADVVPEALYVTTPDAPIERAAARMAERQVSGLPVVVGDELVGILTIGDVLRAFVGMLGDREGGTRVVLDLPDRPGVLERVAGVAAPSNIVAVASSVVEAGRTRRVTVRVVGPDAAAYPDRLRAAGFEVRDARDEGATPP